MKICSFLPSGTEILFALGLSDSVAGVTSRCDYPAAALTKPVVVRSRLPPHVSEREIDREVKKWSQAGRSLYWLDAEQLKQIQPDLIITQDLCHVCAASPEDLGAILGLLSPQPKIIAISPRTVGDIWNNILEVGSATARRDEARELVSRLTYQISTLPKISETPPRVLCLEWLDPPFVAGHWVPEMVELAGGTDVLGHSAEPGYEVTWQTIADSDPDVILAMPCGYHTSEVEEELRIVSFPPEWQSLRAVRTSNVFAMDASSHFSRSGPRIAEGVLAMAALFRRTAIPRKPAFPVGLTTERLRVKRQR